MTDESRRVSARLMTKEEFGVHWIVNGRFFSHPLSKLMSRDLELSLMKNFINEAS
jgi:hypothetical protein